MTEQVPPSGSEGEQAEEQRESQEHGQGQEHGDGQLSATAETLSTGVPAVDQVLADVVGLDQLPLEEHLEIFERAHSSLRSALDAEPGDPA